MYNESSRFMRELFSYKDHFRILSTNVRLYGAWIDLVDIFGYNIDTGKFP